MDRLRVPQIYWHHCYEIADFPLTDWWSDVVKDTKVKYILGQRHIASIQSPKRKLGEIRNTLRQPNTWRNLSSRRSSLLYSK